MAEYFLSKKKDRAKFLTIWEAIFKGATTKKVLAAPAIADENINNVPWFDDAIVLRTSKTDVAILTDTAGARAQVGHFDINIDQPYGFWFTEQSNWQEWDIPEVTGSTLGDVRVIKTAATDKYVYAKSVVIQVDSNWLILEDRADMMHVSVVATAPDEP